MTASDVAPGTSNTPRTFTWSRTSVLRAREVVRLLSCERQGVRSAPRPRVHRVKALCRIRSHRHPHPGARRGHRQLRRGPALWSAVGLNRKVTGRRDGRVAETLRKGRRFPNARRSESAAHWRVGHYCGCQRTEGSRPPGRSVQRGQACRVPCGSVDGGSSSR
jgi:hypothetical protein